MHSLVPVLTCIILLVLASVFIFTVMVLLEAQKKKVRIYFFAAVIHDFFQFCLFRCLHFF